MEEKELQPSEIIATSLLLLLSTLLQLLNYTINYLYENKYTTIKKNKNERGNSNKYIKKKKKMNVYTKTVVITSKFK